MIVLSNKGEISMNIDINDNTKAKFDTIKAGSVVTDLNHNYFIIAWDVDNETFGLVNLFTGEYLPDTFENISEINGYFLVNSILNINLQENITRQSLTLYTSMGAIVETIPVSNTSTLQVNVSAYPAGLYLLKYTDRNTTRVLKIQKY